MASNLIKNSLAKIVIDVIEKMIAKYPKDKQEWLSIAKELIQEIDKINFEKEGN